MVNDPTVDVMTFDPMILLLVVVSIVDDPNVVGP